MTLTRQDSDYILLKFKLDALLLIQAHYYNILSRPYMFMFIHSFILLKKDHLQACITRI